MAERKGSPFTLYLDDEIKMQLNVIAVKKRTNMADIIRNLILKFIEENKENL